MPANDSTEFDYLPGYTKPTHEYGTGFGDEFHAEAVAELLLSTAGYTQRGVTLLGGQGLVPTGAILARESTSGGYTMYQPGGTNGRATAIGVLRDARDTGGSGGATTTLVTGSGTVTISSTTYTASPSGKAATPCLGNIVIRGILNANVVSGTDTASLVPGLNGIGSGAGAALSTLGARVVNFGGANQGLMDGGNAGATANVQAFIF